MKDNFEACLAFVLKHEGGYVDHPKDPGGATKLGVTRQTLSRWLGYPATKNDVKALRNVDVAPIYRKNFWNVCRADDLPYGVDYAVFDFAVNSGTHRAAMALQRAVNVADDGIVGPVTLKAVRTRDPQVIIKRICADRFSFLASLRTWKTFGKGWSARVSGVEKTAIKMAGLAMRAS